MASLDHLNMSVRSFEETAAWYQKVFGFEVVEKGLYEGEPWGILKSEDSMLCVYESKNRIPLDSDPTAERVHRIYHFGLRIKDRNAWEQTLQRERIEVQYGGAVRYPHSHSWYVTDPNGYEIEVALWDNNQVRF